MESQPKKNDPAVEEFLEWLYIASAEQAPDASHEHVMLLEAPARDAATAAGLTEMRGGQLELTGPGLAAAKSVVRRHRLAECLLRDVLGVKEDDLDADACELEHIIQHGLDDRICTLLGHPGQCPHGKPIPQGACCEKASQDMLKDVGPLCEGEVGVQGEVAYLKTRDRRDVQKLMALGILPGVKIRLIRRFPSYVFQLGYSQFTVDRELAEKICVRWPQA